MHGYKGEVGDPVVWEILNITQQHKSDIMIFYIFRDSYEIIDYMTDYMTVYIYIQTVFD